MGVTVSTVYKKLFSKKEVRILMVGLDGAGKTPILYQLKLGKLVRTIPTIGFNIETVEHKNISFIIYDFNANGKMIALWPRYYIGCQALIFVVDSNDRERIDEARDQLHELIHHEALKDAPLLVLANKQDLQDVMSVDEISEKLKLKELKDHVSHIQGTSAVTGYGLYEGLDWIYDKVLH